jgi:hypothetical protein
VVAPVSAREGQSLRVLVLLAIAAIVAIEALYLGMIYNQGGPEPDTTWITPFVAGYLALVGLLLVVSLLASGALRAGVLGAASGGLVVMGALAAFSIGLAVLVAAGLSIAALVVSVARRPLTKTVVSAIAGFVLSIAFLIAGFQVAWQHIECPATGQSGGTTASFIGPGVSYECNNGRLTVNR